MRFRGRLSSYRILILIAVAIGGCDKNLTPTQWRISDSRPASGLCKTSALSSSPTKVIKSRTASDAKRYCDIIAVPVVSLSPDPTGGHPDPGDQVVRTTDGRYFTTTTGGHQIAEWSSEGKFIKSVGREGMGPGELSPRGALMIFLGASDTLFVLDGDQRWSVFDTDLEYARNFVGRSNGRNSMSIKLMKEGILTTGALAGGGADTDKSFHLMSYEGIGVRSFGPELGTPEGERISTLASDGEFWVPPVSGSHGRIELERWSPEGRRTALIRRKTSWLPEKGYAPIRGEPQLPEYDFIHVDANGLLWIGIVVRDRRWRQLQGAERRKYQDELYDARIEVLDPTSGRIIASLTYDGPSTPMPPFGRFFPSSNRAYRIAEDSLGFRSIQVYDVFLVEK